VVPVSANPDQAFSKSDEHDRSCPHARSASISRRGVGQSQEEALSSTNSRWRNYKKQMIRLALMWNWQKRLAFSLFEQEERAYELMTSLDADGFDDPDF